VAEERRGDVTVAEMSLDQIREQLALAVNRVMAEARLRSRLPRWRSSRRAAT